MFINPKDALQNEWIKGVKDLAKQVQPNAVDFTLDTLKKVTKTEAVISESEKVMRPLEDVELVDGFWTLKAGVVYDGTSEMFVDVPAGAAAILYTRSTFARNGIFIVSGLYDSGYKGHVGFTIYPISGSVKIAPGTRIGQIALVSANSAGLYAGGYNHDKGTHYTTEQKSPVTGTPPVQTSGPNWVDPPIGSSVGSYTQGMAGQKQIPSDPRRTETGMGPMLGRGSEFI